MRQGKEFKGRQFTAEVILWAVRWYLMFPISYRDLELMLQDRGVEVDHTTLFRWIQAYAPELEKRIRPHLHRSNGSWRVDETYGHLEKFVLSGCEVRCLGEKRFLRVLKGALSRSRGWVALAKGCFRRRWAPAWWRCALSPAMRAWPSAPGRPIG